MELHITFDTAKLAKEKHYMDGNRISKLFPKLGYVNCSPCYDEKGVLWNCKFYDPTDNYYLAPTQSKLQKWLRDIHKIHIIIVPTIHGYWTYKIVDIQIDPSKKIVRPPHSIDASGVDYNTYEEALESAFLEALKTWI